MQARPYGVSFVILRNCIRSSVSIIRDSKIIDAWAGKLALFVDILKDRHPVTEGSDLL
jgi:hypothetical protein